MISLQDKKKECVFTIPIDSRRVASFFSYIHTVRHFDFENNII